MVFEKNSFEDKPKFFIRKNEIYIRVRHSYGNIYRIRTDSDLYFLDSFTEIVSRVDKEFNGRYRSLEILHLRAYELRNKNMKRPMRRSIYKITDVNLS